MTDHSRRSRKAGCTSSPGELLQRSLPAAAGLALVSGLARTVHAAGDETLKVALIGCGFRGSGAVTQVLSTKGPVKLWAMADVFEDRIERSLKALAAGEEATYEREKHGGFASRIDVPPERRFVGFDAYKQAIDCGVDLVILATYPHFRPIHLQYAVQQGKHVFCEKPVAVDAPGIRSVLETSEAAAAKKLSIVSGLCWRYDSAVRETMKRILDGAIGELLAIQVIYNAGMIGGRDRDPKLTEMQYQLRNWYCFHWLSGDHNVEQHVHSLDKALWAMRDEPPARAWGLGGRQVRTDPRYGDIYDHHAVVYEYANAVRVYSFCRQQAGAWSSVTDHFFGTKGRACVLGKKDEEFSVADLAGNVQWKYKGEKPSMYVAEHQELFQSIRSGKPINNGRYMAYSTMLAILGRMVNYTGQLIAWDDAMKSKQLLAPASYAWDAEPPTKPGPDGRYPIAMPGITPFV